ncbi:TadE family protein [Actinomyces viscosus]|uniref:TadE family protein n=1 Tax=Actinomyces viscosus TaxID=1656 RepID=UPI0036F19DD5
MLSEWAHRCGEPQRPDRAVTRRRRIRPRPRDESGSAVVDFVMVGALVIIVFVALLQVALGVYARNVLTDAAGDGARRAALVGGTENEARQRVQVLSDAALRRGYVDTVTVSRVPSDDLTIVEVTVTAPFPVLGLFGPGGTLTVTGHAVDEASLVRERSEREPDGD